MITTYNLFISYSWRYGDQYDCLISLLKEDPYFHFKDYSISKIVQFITLSNDKQIYEVIKREI